MDHVKIDSFVARLKKDLEDYETTLGKYHNQPRKVKKAYRQDYYSKNRDEILTRNRARYSNMSPQEKELQKKKRRLRHLVKKMARLKVYN